LGTKTVIHKGKPIVVSDSSKVFNFLKSLEGAEIQVGKIPPGYAHRPDNISNLFYDTVTKDWVLMMFNNIKDPFQELNSGDIIIIPKT